jgi:hypothetical protein
MNTNSSYRTDPTDSKKSVALVPRCDEEHPINTIDSSDEIDGEEWLKWDVEEKTEYVTELIIHHLEAEGCRFTKADHIEKVVNVTEMIRTRSMVKFT